jgi:hypothetical protein
MIPLNVADEVQEELNESTKNLKQNEVPKSSGQVVSSQKHYSPSKDIKSRRLP